MPVTPRCLIETKHAPGAVAQQFAATAKTIVDKFTATNTGTNEATLTLHLVPSGATVGPSNKVLEVLIEQGKAYLCAELVGHILEPGDVIAGGADVASTIAIRASGREVT
jgi:hypothetical protein